MNCLLSGAIVRIGGAQKRADGVAGAKYSTAMLIGRKCLIFWDFLLFYDAVHFYLLHYHMWLLLH